MVLALLLLGLDFSRDVISDFDQKMKLDVVVAAFVEVQSKAVVKVGVRVVYMKGVVHSEINLEG